MDSFYYLAMDTGIVKLHEFNRANDGIAPTQAATINNGV